MFVCLLSSLLATLYYCQYAVINEHQIIFKSLLCSFGYINISDVKLIKKESLITFSNTYGFKSNCDWLVFYTDENKYDVPKQGLNKKNATTFMIPFNQKNVLIIKQTFKSDVIVNF